MIRRPPRSTLFPTRRSSDLRGGQNQVRLLTRELARVHGIELRLVTKRHSELARRGAGAGADRKSTRLNSSHSQKSYAVFCLKKKKKQVMVACHLIVERWYAR